MKGNLGACIVKCLKSDYGKNNLTGVKVIKTQQMQNPFGCG